MPPLELIFAESGPTRDNAGDASLPTTRLEPSLSSFLRWLPEGTHVVLYTDQDWPETKGLEVRRVDNPYGEHPRAGHRFNDLYQAVGMLASRAQVSIAVDSDLLALDRRVSLLDPMASHLGLCLPVNGRWMAYLDAASDCDGGHVEDLCMGASLSHATGLWAFSREDRRGRSLLEAYRYQMETNPCRGPLALWRAQMETGISPNTLPPQWLVTGNMPLEQIRDPIVLHVGHENVRQHYAELIKE